MSRRKRETRTLRSDVAGCIPLREQETHSWSRVLSREFAVRPARLARYQTVFSTPSRIAYLEFIARQSRRALGRLPFFHIRVCTRTAATVVSERHYYRGGISVGIINRVLKIACTVDREPVKSDKKKRYIYIYIIFINMLIT